MIESDMNNNEYIPVNTNNYIPPSNSSKQPSNGSIPYTNSTIKKIMLKIKRNKDEKETTYKPPFYRHAGNHVLHVSTL